MNCKQMDRIYGRKLSGNLHRYRAGLQARMLCASVAVLLAGSANVAISPAATDIWKGQTADWNTASNWSPGQPGPGDIAQFSGLNGFTALTLSSPVDLSGISFIGSGLPDYSIGTSAGPTMTLADSGYITLAATVHTNQAINASILLDGNANVSVLSNIVNSTTLTLGNITGSAVAGAVNTLTASASNYGPYIRFDGVISDGANGGRLGLNIDSYANVFLTGNNTYSGGTYLGFETRTTITSNGNLGADGTPVVSNAGYLLVNASTTINRPLDVLNDSLTLASNNHNVNWAGNISGSGYLTLCDTVIATGGDITLSGVNTISGGISVSQTTLSIGKVSALGTGGLDLLEGILQTTSGLIYNGQILVFSPGNGFDADGNTDSFNGFISGSGSLDILNSSTTAPGFITLGNATNNFSGGTSIGPNVTLSIASAGALGSGGLTLTGGTLQTSGNVAFANAVSLGTGAVDTNGHSVVFSGLVTGGSTTAITDTSAGGTGILTLTNSADAISGTVVLDAGRLALNNDAELANVTLDFNGGTLQFNNYNSSLPIVAANTIIGPNSGKEIALGAALGSPSTYGGNLLSYQGNASDAGLVYNGPGTLILTGNNDALTGCVLNAGTLGITSDSAMGGNVFFFEFNGGTLQFVNYTSNSQFLNANPNNLGPNAGGNISLGAALGTPSALNEGVAGNFGLVFHGPGTLVLAGNDAYTGNTILEGGIIAVANDLETGSGTILFDGGTLQLNNFASGMSFSNTNVDPRTNAAISLAAADGIPATLNGTVTGHVNFQFMGTGTLNLTAVNSYTGTTDITGGTLALADKGTVADSQFVAINANASFDISQTSGGATVNGLQGSGSVFLGNQNLAIAPAAGSQFAFNGIIQDGGIAGQTGGSLSLNGPGTLTLDSINTYSGGTSINEGILAVTNSAGLGTGSVTFNGGTLQFDAGTGTFSQSLVSGTAPITLNVQNGASLSYIGVLSDAGQGVVFNGPGTLSLATDQTLTTGITINSGTLQLGATNLTAGSVTNNGVLQTGGIISTTGAGLDNEGDMRISNASISGGQLLNNGLLEGSAVITGIGLYNNGTVNDTLNGAAGNLVLDTADNINFNYGTINLTAGYHLELQACTLMNQGTINLNGGNLSGSGAINNIGGGVVEGEGNISATFNNQQGGLLLLTSGTTHLVSAVTNRGTVELQGLSANLTGNTLTNNGTIMGYGNVGANVVNDQTIQAVGGTLNLGGAVINEGGGIITAGSGTQVTLGNGLAGDNAGIINLTGGELNTNGHAFTNTGEISGYGVFAFGTLTNGDMSVSGTPGSVTFSGGTTTVDGNVVNNSSLTMEYNPVIFTGAVTNNGLITTTQATATYAGSFTNNGSQITDPTTTNYDSDWITGTTGYTQATAGDVFNALAGVIIHSTQSTKWNTGGALLNFLGAYSHNFALAGSDAGAIPSGFTNNFAWGQISLGSGVTINLQDGNPANSSTALYTYAITGLSIQGTQILNIAGNGDNIYYDSGNSLNSYLHGAEFSLQNGGSLIPVSTPEPAGLSLAAAGAGLLLLRRVRCGHRAGKK